MGWTNMKKLKHATTYPLGKLDPANTAGLVGGRDLFATGITGFVSLCRYERWQSESIYKGRKILQTLPPPSGTTTTWHQHQTSTTPPCYHKGFCNPRCSNRISWESLYGSSWWITRPFVVSVLKCMWVLKKKTRRVRIEAFILKSFLIVVNVFCFLMNWNRGIKQVSNM